MPRPALVPSLDRLATRSDQVSGTTGKSSQVRPRSQSAGRVCGHPVQPADKDCQTSSSSDPKVPVPAGQVPVQNQPSCRDVATSTRPHDITGTAGSTGPSPHAASAVPSTRAVVTLAGPPSTTSTYQRGVQADTTVVAVGNPLVNRGTPPTTYSSVDPVLGCLHRGLGCTPQPAPDRGNMDTCTTEPPHQQPGDVGSDSSSQTFQRVGPVQDSVTDVGQHHSGCSNQEPGRHSLPRAVQSHSAALPVGPPTPGDSGSQTHTGSLERNCRPPLKTTPGHSHRVVSVPSGGTADMEGVGPAARRHVRHPRKHQTAHVRLSTTRQPGVEDRRTLILVGRSVDVPVSTHSASSGGSTQNCTVPVRGSSGSTSMASTDVVQPTPTAVRRPPSVATGNTDPAETTELSDIPSEPQPTGASRLASIRTSLQEKGYSEAVARRIATAHRDSTQAIYDSRWRIYHDWCTERGEDPFTAPTTLIADFLNYLFTVKNLASTTLGGYRTVITATIRQVTGTDIRDDHHLSSLLTQFAIERPRSHNTSPPWNLALVLSALQHHPFEPLREAPLWALTYKTIFLTALGTAKRRGELHAFLHKIRHAEDWTRLVLVPDPVFVAKTEKPGQPDTKLQEVTVEALGAFVGPDLPRDASNCVVRAIKIYLARTQSFRGKRKRLFISYKQSKQMRSRPRPYPAGLSRLFAMPMRTLQRRLLVSTESVPMTSGACPPAGMHSRTCGCRRSCVQLNGVPTPRSHPSI